MSGRAFRMLRHPKGFASSLVLLPSEIDRLFGPATQLLVTPAPGILLSIPPDIPSWSIADIATEFEERAPFPLFLDPFLYEDGSITWAPDVDDPDDTEERWAS